MKQKVVAHRKIREMTEERSPKILVLQFKNKEL